MNLSTKPDFVSGPETTASGSILVLAGLQRASNGYLDNEPYSVGFYASGTLNLLTFLDVFDDFLLHEACSVRSAVPDHKRYGFTQL